jgi:methylmalonyl-CoA/ethylmalonyl-CoA epimerase
MSADPQVAPDALGELRFHHLGFATQSCEREAETLALLGYAPEGEAFIDPVQEIRGLFLVGGGPRIELLEPLRGAKTLDPWLRKGIKIYHHAYETPAIDESIVRAREAGARLVSGPREAVAFDHMRVAFLMLPSMYMFELVDTAGRGE